MRVATKVSHSFTTDGLSKEEAFKEIVKFCSEKQLIKHPYSRGEIFKSILKTSEVLLDKIYYFLEEKKSGGHKPPLP